MKPSFGSFTLFVAFSLLAVFAKAEEVPAPKVLLVSDIDDTIKVSHVLNKVGKFARAVDATTPFKGMAQLYQLIVNQNPSSTKVAYLSNAPKNIGAIPNAPQAIAGIPAASVTHQLFLDFNHFPKGELILREDLEDQDHKTKALRMLIEREKPDVLILIGDNGEHDVDFYRQATQEHAYMKNMQVLTFIHELYKTEASFYLPDFLDETGREVFPEQMGFVTPIEISLKLNEERVIGKDKVDWMIKNVAPSIAQEDKIKWDGLKPISFPFFKKCPQFKWTFSRPQQLQSLIQRIESECN